MTSNRNNQKQLWADKEFIDLIEKLKGKLESQGIKVGNLAEVTRRIAKTIDIGEIEKQLLQIQNIGDFKIKMDSRRFGK